jgi:hypothetical protein
MKNFLLLSLLVFATLTHSQPLDRLKDYRMCGVVVRDTNGNIKRSSAVLTAYKKIHPCPSTGLTTGACPGWALNHSIPLACGGCDAVYNLTWTPDQIKSCADSWCIDRYERKINASTPPVPDSAACVNAFPVDLK